MKTIWLFSLLLIALVVACLPALAQAPTQETWTNADGNNLWSDGNNWTPPTDPGGPNGNFNVSIPSNSGGPTTDVSATIVKLEIGEVAGVIITGLNQLTITGTTIANDGILDIGETGGLGILQIDDTVTLSGTGTVMINSGTSLISGGGTLINQQTISGVGTISASLQNQGPDGQIYGASPSTPLIVTGPVTNSGLISGVVEFVNNTVQNAGGTIGGAGGLAQLNGCTIVGGTIGNASAVPVATSGEAAKNRKLTPRRRKAEVAPSSTPPAGAPTLNGVTISGGYLVASTSDDDAGTILVGTITNNGTILIDGGDEDEPTSVLYIPGAVSLTGTGTVNVEGATASLTGPGTLTNQQTINVGGGKLDVPQFINQGTLNAADAVVFVPSSGTFNNTNGVFNVTAGTVNLFGGTFTGGKVVVFSGATLELDNGITLSGVVFSGPGTVIAENAVLNNRVAVNTVTIIIIIDDDGVLTLEGSLLILSPGGIALQSDLGGIALLVIDGSVDINGTGGITAGNSPNNQIGGAAGKKNALTINVPTFTASGTIGDGTFPITIGAHTTVINNGAQPLIFDVGTNSFKNLGTLETSGSGDIRILGNFANYNATTNTLTGGTYMIGGELQFENANLVNNAAKLILVQGGQILNLNGGNGLANFSNNTAKGTFELSGDQFETGGTFNNEGTVDVSAGSFLIIGGTSTNYNQSGATAVTTVDGELTVPAGGLTNVTGGTLQASGLFSGDVSVGNAAGGAAATFIVGDSKKSSAQVSMQNTYTQLATGVMDVQVGGTTAGSGYSQLSVTDAVNLAGTLNIADINKFKPALGQVFTILNGSSGIAGAFSTINGTSINSAEHYAVTQNPTNVTLTVEPGN